MSLLLFQPKPGLWKTKDGRVIPIVDLADNHLEKIIEMLKTNHPKLPTAYTLRQYLTGPEPTADGALMAFNHEIDQLIDATDLKTDSLTPLYAAVVEERDRRKRERKTA